MLDSEHSSSSVGSDYYSQASPGSRSSVASETGSERGEAERERGGHSPLSATKSFTYPDPETSTSCSYFRSPKLNAKVRCYNKSSAILGLTSSCDSRRWASLRCRALQRGADSARLTRGLTPCPAPASSPSSPPGPAPTSSPASGSISARLTSTRPGRTLKPAEPVRPDEVILTSITKNEKFESQTFKIKIILVTGRISKNGKYIFKINIR